MSPKKAHYSGFTLIEMVISVAIISILMTAIASAILLTSKAIPSQDSPGDAALKATKALARLNEELQSVRFFTEATSTAMTIIVPDQNGDGDAEQIRYSWSGTAGDPLVRTLNGSVNTENVVASAQSVDFSYSMDDVSELFTDLGGETARLVFRHVRSVYVRIKLDTGDVNNVETAILHLNSPPILDAVHELDFDTNPVTTDADANGIADWSTADSSVFDTATLTDGVWDVGTDLVTSPQYDFGGVTTLWARMAATTSGNVGPIIRLNVDSAVTGGPISAWLKLETDGTQTLHVSEHTGGTRTDLITANRLPAGFIDLRLIVDSATDRINVRVNNVDIGTYSFNRENLATFGKVVRLREGAAGGRFDFVRIYSGGTVKR